ncbi:molybdopterin molybdotransferase MoeA, partial [Paenibacillus koleovorans]|uniref:molybdopterin molybdotransferase MoeA n=1 Tax=Paenibacillus koleovorans TaxID=121608 RepID=UPI0013E3F2C0
TPLGAGELAVLASLGHARVAVRCRPRVAVLATGAELLPVDAPSPLAPGRIRDSNSAMLASLVAEAGGEAEQLQAVSDRLEDVLPVVRQALDSGEYDMLLTSGGVSVGDHDVMVDLFDTWGGRLLFNKVQMRPGSPTTAGCRNDRLLIALSGNPGACLVGFRLLVRPALQSLLGEPRATAAQLSLSSTHPGPPAPLQLYEEAILDGAPIKGIALERYVRAKLRLNGGRVYAMPCAGNKSSDLLSLREAECLIVVPPGGEGVQPGAVVRIIRL